MKVMDKTPSQSYLVWERRSNIITSIQCLLVFVLAWLFGYLVGHPL